MRSGIPSSHPLHSRISELLLSLTQLLLDLQKDQPLAFRAYLPDAVQLSEWTLERSFDGSGELLFSELSVICLSTMQHILREPAYHSASNLARSALTFSLHGGLKVDPAAAADAQSIMSTLVNPRLVSSLCAVLVNRFFPLSPSELRLWSDDSEHFILESTLDDEWPRFAALRLFGFLVQQHTQQVASFVLQTLHSLAHSTAASPLSPSASPPAAQHLLSSPSSAGGSSPASPSLPLSPSSASSPQFSDAALLNARGAAFLALAACSHDLPPLLVHNPAVFDFASFFMHTLRDELNALLALVSSSSSSAAASSPLASARSCLSTRLLYVLGEWCESVPVSCHSAVYELIGCGLSVHDLAVRYFAGKCLERFVVCSVHSDDVVAAQQLYAQYVDRLFRLLFPLIDALESLDLQKSLVLAVRASLVCLGPLVAPAVGTLLDALPRLWSSCDDANNNMLRATLLDTLTELTRALGAHSERMQPFALQVIAYCLDHTKADREYLHQYVSHRLIQRNTSNSAGGCSNRTLLMCSCSCRRWVVCYQALELWEVTLQQATTFTQVILKPKQYLADV